MASNDASECPLIAQIPTPQNRPRANFHPSVWGNQFLEYVPEDKVKRTSKEKEVEDLKEKVRRKLKVAAGGGGGSGNSSQLLNFIDAVQRLGLGYHFEREIEEVLRHVYDSFQDGGEIYEDLYDSALLFRLVRQQGYKISCGIFNKFTYEDNHFREDLVSDVRGILGLYEAAYLKTHGDDILEEALAFTTTHLKSMVDHLEYPLSKQVVRYLNRPIRKSLERLEARWYMSIYQDEDFHDETLLKLAKLDFNLVQSLHKEELHNVSRWWEQLDFTKNLSFARNRLVEGYFWMIGVYFEPQYSHAREFFVKVFTLTSIVDDIYDAYGTMDELNILSEAIERWDINYRDQLPEYLKPFYEALLSVYEEMEKEMEKEGKHYRIHYAKEAMKHIIRDGYFAEAKWYFEGYTPTLDEYMRVALVSSGAAMLATSSFVGMGDVVTKQAFDWVITEPKIITASNVVVRLMDDITSHEFEQKRGHVASAVECYMKQYGVSSAELVYNELRKQVVNAWMDINQACLMPTDIPMVLLNRILNFSRVMDLIYKDEDGYTHVGKAMINNIASLLIHPVE